MHSFEVHSKESACRKKVRLGLEQVITEKWRQNQKYTCQISELLGLSAKKPTIVLPVATQTPTLPYISLPIQSQGVSVPPVLHTITSQRVPVSQPTPTQGMQKEFSTPKPW